MGSFNAPIDHPWTPPNNALFRDCSQGICSFYCPQWCYIVYPPPPPPTSFTLGVAAGDDHSGSSFQLSPLIVALIGILASAFILLTYYTVISRFCRRRAQIHENHDSINNSHQSSQANAPSSSSSGLDESLIRSIKVFKYKKGDGSVDGTDCSVCLSEFQDSESLRVLPKCNHAFHLPCIDTWLKSNSTCPLCRSNIIFIPTTATSCPSSSTTTPNQREGTIPEEAQTTSVNISALEYQHRNDTVIVIQGSDHPSVVRQEIQVGLGGVHELNYELNSCSSQGRLSVADILRDSEEGEEEVQMGREREKKMAKATR